VQYRDEQKYIQDHREELERLLKQEQEAMAGEVPGNLWEAFDALKGKPKDAAQLDASNAKDDESQSGSSTTSTPSPTS
jgi:import inner membrane translocase subunit TIM50